MNILKARGTFRPTRHAKRAAEPVALGDLLGPPDWLSAGQKQVWDDAVAHAPAGLLRAADRGLMAVFCCAVDQHKTAAKMQAKIDARGGSPLLLNGRPSPYLKVIAKAAEVMLRSGAELGFTPIARSRLASPDVPPAAEDSGWARLRLLHGGKGEPPAIA